MCLFYLHAIQSMGQSHVCARHAKATGPRRGTENGGRGKKSRAFPVGMSTCFRERSLCQVCARVSL